ncbi:argininosuccinate lyase [Dinochytrium kinnereticum]|nr:argininosuccinate lyase [Dinochytrium kinnereticum]
MSLWGGRFSGKVDPLMEAFNASIGFDKRLWRADITASQSYAKALAKSGIIAESERDEIVSGLDTVAQEWASGSFAIQPSDEDIHTANERRLTELIGAVAGKLHTGRSRNDQVATDMRLWLRFELETLGDSLRELLRIITERAAREIDVLMPGYTHLQRAQPIRWSHWLLSYAWGWQADLERLMQLLDRMNKLPLGSGALAGNPFQVDRQWLASDMGFNGIIPNSLLGVGDRDFVAEFLSWSSLTMIHLSRFAEDLIIYSSHEFGFVKLADAYSTGSSLMPQKKNPDSMELVRGKSGRVFGNMAGFLMTLKGIPSTYNKDLQEDKEPMFDSLDNVKGCIEICSGVISTLDINKEKMESSLSYDMLATDLAEYLVRKKIPFRDTHHIAGRAVRMAEERKGSLKDLSLADLKTLHPAFEQDAMELWNFQKSVDNRNAAGGTSKDAVEEQIRALRESFSASGKKRKENGSK